MYGTSGQADLLCRVVARSTPDLQEIIARILASPAVQRTDTTIALSVQIPFRVDPCSPPRRSADGPRRRQHP
nr:hypothetical protein GCM10020093_059070 [Planobispora longispora]